MVKRMLKFADRAAVRLVPKTTAAATSCECLCLTGDLNILLWKCPDASDGNKLVCTEIICEG